MPLSGLAVPTPTLFADDGSIDPARNRLFTEGLCDASIDHIFAMGSLGEFPSIDDDERPRLLAGIQDGLRGATDLWVGVGAPATHRAVRLAVAAQEAGAAVLVATPPFYLEPTEAAIASYYQAIAAEIRRPLLAYNIPSKVGYRLSPTLVHGLAKKGILAGIKDTAGSIDSVRSFLTGAPPGFLVFPGDDDLARAALGAGAAGAVMGLANVLPRLAVEFLRSVMSSSDTTTNDLEADLLALAAIVKQGPFPSTTKFLARLLRSAPDGYRPPFVALTPAESERVWGALAPQEARLRRWL